jgi:hypothetical protein
MANIRRIAMAELYAKAHHELLAFTLAEKWSDDFDEAARLT